MTVLCLVIGGALIIGERCMDARDRCDSDQQRSEFDVRDLPVIQKEKTP